ncbi:GNAT family N-acetyltransferase [Aquibacillus sediminis]|uniref:GNAT family N-acetyltransferase n=1 Tax=Aquibacillus sediminis TaxID=2574734 RepID=UPI00110813A7|nr:GNAT family protein [Aquibacillus sediminis]
MKGNIRLRAFEQEDISSLHHWFNDQESMIMAGRVPMSYEETEEFVLTIKKEGAIVLAIEHDQQGLVGWIHLSNRSMEHGRAEIGLLLDPHYRGQGYGKEAMDAMLDIGFNQLRLHKIFLTTRGINQRAKRLYEKLGFVVEGTLRQHCYVNGNYYDTYFMGILADEWRGNDKSE